MENEKFMSMLSRLFFFGALTFLGLAIVQKGVMLLFGFQIPFLEVLPTLLLSWTVPLLLFVIAILLRQIREDLRRS